MEPAEPGIMSREPRDPNEAIIAGNDLKRMIFESGIIGLGVMGAYYAGMRRYGIGPGAATLAFNTLTMSELAHAYSSRSHYRNVFGGIKLPPNKALLAAIGGMTVLQAVVSLVPGARRMLGTTPLGLIDLVIVAAGVLGPLIINEATKPSAPRKVIEELEGRSGGTSVAEKNTKQEQAA